MAVNNINSGMNDIYSSMFGTSNTTAQSGNGSSILGDYSLIQSGAYKKILKAYYAKEDAAKGTKETEEDKDSSISLMNTRTSAENLMESIGALRNGSLYESTGKDENGNSVYDREKILGAVKGFVEDYNSYLEASGDLDSTSILGKTLNMVKATKSNANLLSQVGITIGKDNKLELNEETLNKAAVTTLSSLFESHASYGDRIQLLTGQSYKLANSQVYTNRHASAYTFDGTYSILGTGNGRMDKYL